MKTDQNPTVDILTMINPLKKKVKDLKKEIEKDQKELTRYNRLLFDRIHRFRRKYNKDNCQLTIFQLL